MQTCASCGNGNPPEARFCFACGTPLAVAPVEARKTITVLFVDVTGSTALAEAMDPESYRSVMTRFFSETLAVVARHGGKVEKFIGDAVVAVYGIPILREDDAARAVRTAFDLRETVAALSVDLQRQWGLQFAVRTGINTGEVVVGGSVGGQDVALGDTSNVAARLEQAAPPGEILISASTYRLVRDVVDATPVEPLELKGKRAPVAAYRLDAVLPDRPGMSRGPLLPMVGRDGELAVVLDAFDRAVEQRAARLVTVSGSPGLGKSRLLVAVRERLADRAVVAFGNCVPYGQGVTYAPVAAIVQQVRELGGCSDDAALSELLHGSTEADAVVRRVGRLASGDDLDESPDEMASAVRRLLEAVAAGTPVVVLLEDLHWAEPALLDLVEHVVDRAKDVPLLLVTTARPELREMRPGWAARAQTVALEPLDPTASQALVRQAAKDAPLSEPTLRKIASAAGGNPLFMEQTLSMLLDDEDAAGAASRASGDVPVPPSISALLAARVDALAPPERDVLERASVAGIEFSLAALSALSPADPLPSLTAHLDALTRKDFIETAHFGIASGQTYRFRHALIREAAYASVSKVKRATLHEELATWLERRRDDGLAVDDEMVGFHLEHAFRYKRDLRIADARLSDLAERACACLGRAGRRARARQDMRGATGLLARAVALAARDDASKARLLLELGAAHVDTGDNDAAQRAFTEATEVARRVGDSLAESEGLLSLADLLSRTDPTEGTSDRLFEQIEKAIALFEQFDHWQGLAIAWNSISHIQNLRGSQAAKHSASLNAVHYAQLAEDADIEAWARYGIVSSLKNGPVPLTEAIAQAEELIAWAAEKGNRQLEGLTLATLSHMYAMRGGLDDARRAARSARATLEELGAQFVLAIQYRTEALVEMLAGDVAEATRLLRNSYDLLEAMGDKTFRASVAPPLAQMLYVAGEDEQARRYVAIARSLAQVDDLDAQVGWRRVEGKLLERAGRLDAAERVLREAVALVESTDTVYLQAESLEGLADVLALAGRPDEARAAAAQVLRLYEAKENVLDAERVRRRWRTELAER